MRGLSVSLTTRDMASQSSLDLGGFNSADVNHRRPGFRVLTQRMTRRARQGDESRTPIRAVNTFHVERVMMTTFLVFHESGDYDSYLYVNEVEATNAMNAASKVHKSEHHNAGEYEYYVCPKSSVIRIKASEPKSTVFTVTTGLRDDRVSVIKDPKPKSKKPRK